MRELLTSPLAMSLPIQQPQSLARWPSEPSMHAVGRTWMVAALPGRRKIGERWQFSARRLVPEGLLRAELVHMPDHASHVGVQNPAHVADVGAVLAVLWVLGEPAGAVGKEVERNIVQRERVVNRKLREHLRGAATLVVRVPRARTAATCPSLRKHVVGPR